MKREIYKTLLDNNFSNFNSNPMLTPADHKRNAIRRQLIEDLLESHLSFDHIRATTTWDEFTCLEQMTLEDLIDM